MTDTIITITIGVFSGIITSATIWFSIQIFKKIIVPWYQQSIYRGIDISGDWVSSQNYAGGVSVEQIIQIKQKGHRLSGTLISQNKIPNIGEDTTAFTLDGEIFDNYVDIEYQINDNKSIGRGSQLLKVKEGGVKLEGGLIAIDRISSEIMTSENIQWKRKK